MTNPTGQANRLMAIPSSVQLEWRELAQKSPEGRDTQHGEQASRLIAMDGATRNTERMQTQLLELKQRERQDEITRDILELISARTSLE